jgi:prevent-host-death family protein
MCDTVTHMMFVGVRELRQNLSRYLDRVKAGETLVVTERGEEVARVVPSRAAAYAGLAARYGATVPTVSVEEVAGRLTNEPAEAGATDAYLADSRGERV